VIGIFELSRSLEPEEGVVGGRVKIEMLWIHGKQRIICLVCLPFLLIFSLPSFFTFSSSSSSFFSTPYWRLSGMLYFHFHLFMLP